MAIPLFLVLNAHLGLGIRDEVFSRARSYILFFTNQWKNSVILSKIDIPMYCFICPKKYVYPFICNVIFIELVQAVFFLNDLKGIDNGR